MYNDRSQVKDILTYVVERAYQYNIIKVSEINFTREVVAACKTNTCGRYGKCWTCPPAVGELDDLIAKYSLYDEAIVYTTRHDLEDSFDIEGMMAGQAAHGQIDSEIIALLDKDTMALLGSGGCNYCDKCSYPDAPCRHSDIAIPSVEAVGIDVVNLASKCNINYHNGVNTVTYFSVIFYKDLVN